ncbi:hypothetical protein L2214_22005, partial [Xanthomonas perforans]|uniref:hypothetical protein n=1 Tax=Xanthomonas perforans TaxID=442694 RepID=UPI001F21D082
MDRRKAGSTEPAFFDLALVIAQAPLTPGQVVVGRYRRCARTYTLPVMDPDSHTGQVCLTVRVVAVRCASQAQSRSWLTEGIMRSLLSGHA